MISVKFVNVLETKKKPATICQSVNFFIKVVCRIQSRRSCNEICKTIYTRLKRETSMNYCGSWMKSSYVTVTQDDFQIPATYTLVLSVFLNNFFLFLPTCRKKRVSERVLRRAMHIIRSETLGRCLASAKSLAKRLAEGLTKSLGETLSESLGEPFGDSWRDFSRSPSISSESRIGLYARLSTRLSPKPVFLRGYSFLTSTILFPRFFPFD